MVLKAICVQQDNKCSRETLPKKVEHRVRVCLKTATSEVLKGKFFAKLGRIEESKPDKTKEMLERVMRECWALVRCARNAALPDAIFQVPEGSLFCQKFLSLFIDFP